MDEIKDAWFEFVLDGKTTRDKSAGNQDSEDKQSKEIAKPILESTKIYAHQKTLIVGSPGAGKSTLLKRLLFDAALKASQNESGLIPVLVELRDYRTIGDYSGIRGLILESLESHDPNLNEDILKQLLSGRRLLLSADGLNELADGSAKQELEKLCLHQGIIATSRNVNDWWNIDRKLEIQSLTPKQTGLAIIDAEFTDIKQSPTHRLATLRQQILNPERHAQAIKATLGEVAKHYLEETVIAKAAITYLDKMSEEPNHGA